MIKKPLVLTSGEIEQLQADDSMSPVPNSLALEAGAELVICTPVYISAADIADVADSDALPNVIGIVAEFILISATGAVQTDGKLTASTGDWDARTGQTGGLTAGSVYYLDSWGTLTTTPPTSGYLTRLGIAVNATDLEIKISRPIKL